MKKKDNIEDNILEDGDDFDSYEFPFEKEEKASSDLGATSATEDEPIKNLLLLILIIPVAPIIFVYSLLMRRRQNGLVLAAIVLLLLGFAFYKIFKMGSDSDYLRNLALFEMVDELSPEEKDALKIKLSTLRKSIGDEKLPKSLGPMLDVPMDMLSINYYYYLINAGYMDETGAGGEIALQTALYSKTKEMKEAAWESLKLVNTKNSQKIMSAYAKKIEDRNNSNKPLLGNSSTPSSLKLPNLADSKLFKKKENSNSKSIFDRINFDRFKK